MGQPEVSMRVLPTTVVPGQTALFIARAIPPAGRSFTVLRLYITDGSFTDSVDIPVRDQPVQVHFDLRVPVGPFEGVVTLTIYGRVETMTATASATVKILDDGAPRLTTGDSAAAAPGDTVRASFTAADSAGIARVELRTTGAFTSTQALDFAPETSRRNGFFSVVIPGNARLGDTIGLDLTALDGFGKSSNAHTKVRLGDIVPPQVDGTIAGPTRDWGTSSALAAFVTGDPLKIVVGATDKARLAWLGYELKSPDAFVARDSTAVTGAIASNAFDVNVAGSWEPAVSLSFFATDSSGNRATLDKPVRFFDGVVRPTQGLQVRTGSLYDRAYDSKRNEFYWSTGEQGLKAVSISPFREISAPNLNGDVVGIDLTPSNDSLVAIVYRSGLGMYYLVVTDLVTPGRPVTSTPIPWESNYRPWIIRVTTDNRAIVPMIGDALPDTNVVEFNLTTGTRRTRTVNKFPAWGFIRSADRSVMLGWDDRGAATYRPGTDVFGSLIGLVRSVRGPSINVDGSRVVLLGKLYDGNLGLIRTLYPEAEEFAHQEISADGSLVWRAVTNGFTTVRTSDGTMLERVFLPLGSYSLNVLPGGESMVVFAQDWVGLVDLR
jgi:hypothetical protein